MKQKKKKTAVRTKTLICFVVNNNKGLWYSCCNTNTNSFAGGKWCSSTMNIWTDGKIAVVIYSCTIERAGPVSQIKSIVALLGFSVKYQEPVNFMEKLKMHEWTIQWQGQTITWTTLITANKTQLGVVWKNILVPCLPFQIRVRRCLFCPGIFNRLVIFMRNG